MNENAAREGTTLLTRSSTDVWYPANAFMGWAPLAAAVTSAAVLTFFPPTAKRWLLLVMFLVPLLWAVFASFMYLHRFV